MQNYFEPLKLKELPEVWLNSALPSILLDEKWENRGINRTTVFGAFLPDNIINNGLGHGDLKICYDLFKKRCQDNEIEPLAYTNFCKNVNRSIDKRIEIESGIIQPSKPKTIRIVP